MPLLSKSKTLPSSKRFARVPIKAPTAFPNTPIVTVGFANELTYVPRGHLPNPPAALSTLRSYSGQDLLARVDGYGMHVYPSVDQLVSWTQSVTSEYESAGLTDKPIYVTVWGFPCAQFPYNGMVRARTRDQPCVESRQFVRPSELRRRQECGSTIKRRT